MMLEADIAAASGVPAVAKNLYLNNLIYCWFGGWRV
jgi:hypothetical protein